MTFGLRCRECNNRSERVEAALHNAEEDAELLRSHELEGTKKAELARRHNVSRAAMGQRIAKARERRALLHEVLSG